jgi:hypothetical protein
MQRLSLSSACGVASFGVGLVGIVIACGGCAAGNSDQSGGGAGGSGPGVGGATQASSAATLSTVSTGSGFNTGSTGTGVMGPAEVFGESKDTLYKLDPDTKAVTTVGAFSGCTGVQDIALDKDSHLYATTLTDLYEIDKDTAVCTHIATGAYPNSLSFVPAGTLDPNVEALVGYVPITVAQKTQNQYVRVDTQTGQISNIGSPWSQEFISSGDVVSVINGPTYLTVKAVNGGTECKAADCLVEVNPQNGAFIQSYGPLNTYKQVFGLAFWAGSVYGFDNAGDLFEVKIQGNTNITTAITVPGGLSFWGAGSTTSAPPVPN